MRAYRDRKPNIRWSIWRKKCGSQRCWRHQEKFHLEPWKPTFRIFSHLLNCNFSYLTLSILLVIFFPLWFSVRFHMWLVLWFLNPLCNRISLTFPYAFQLFCDWKSSHPLTFPRALLLSALEGIPLLCLCALVEDGVHSTLPTCSSASNYIQVTFHQLQHWAHLHRLPIIESSQKVEGFFFPCW